MFVVVLMLVLATALYVAAEFAIVGARVSRIEYFAERGSRNAARLLPIVTDSAALDRYIAACQIGITVSSLVLGAFGQATIGVALGASLIDHYGLPPASAYGLSATLVLVVLTSVHVVLGELIPKTVALQYPARTAIFTYLPMRWSLALYRPFIKMLNGSGNLILRRFGGNPNASHRHLHSPEEIELLISESSKSGLIEASDSTRLREALRLGRRTARQLMVPRRQIQALDLDEPIADLMTQIDASPFTRLPVHRGGLDQIHGILHVKELAVALATGRQIETLDPLVKPLLAIPAGLKTDRVLAQLRERRARLALVVDEFGGIEGLISLEDVIREFVGALSDEFKSGAQLLPKQLSDNQWRLPGRLPLEEMLEWAQADINDPVWSESEAETLAGWLLERFDQVPAVGQVISVAGMRFEVERMAGAAIVSVLVERKASAAEEAGRD
jgi:CBS domain containing-hemolysin-like protein